MHNPTLPRVGHACQDESARPCVPRLIASSAYRPDLEEAQMRAIVERGADALLLIGHDRTPEAYDILDRRHIPCLVAWAYDPGRPRLAIGFDNRRAMQALAAEVIALGHTRLGMITAERSSNDRARHRFEGVEAAMRDGGLDPRDLRTIETPYGIGTGAAAFVEMMAKDPPTAILCGNDVLAAGALKAAREMRLHVPTDVSITGFDDIELAEIVTPALTTVHVPHRAMGRQAAQLLMALRTGPPPTGSVELDAPITWRETLGPAPLR